MTIYFIQTTPTSSSSTNVQDGLGNFYVATISAMIATDSGNWLSITDSGGNLLVKIPAVENQNLTENLPLTVFYTLQASGIARLDVT